MVKVPAPVVHAGDIHDGTTVIVAIRARTRDLYLGPLNVTSGDELYIPRTLQKLLVREREVEFEIRERGA